MKPKKYKKIKLLSKKLQKPILSNTKFDELLSYKGGLMPATSYGIFGDAGAGKSSVAFFISGQIAKTSARVLNVQCEMDEVDVQEYSTRIDMQEVEYLDLINSKTPKKDLEEALYDGWDVVNIDSVNELIESIICHENEKRNVVEKYLTDLIASHKNGKNNKGKCTSFIIVLQITKGGDYKGNKRFEHMLTGMFRITKDENNSSRAITAIKNRKGIVDKPLYFNFSNNGKLVFDEKLNQRHEEIEEMSETNNSILSNSEEDFSEWISNSKKQSVEIVTTLDSNGIGKDENFYFDVVLKAAGGSKLAVVKLVKELTGKGLKDAKDLVDNVPSTLKESCSEDEAEAFKSYLEKYGAEVELIQFFGSSSFLNDDTLN